MDSAWRTRQELEDTFEVLFDKLFRYVRLRIPTPEDAEDLVAEIFTKGWKHAHTYDAKQGTLLMWLFGIARHELASYWHKHNITSVDYQAVEHLLHDRGRSVDRQNAQLDLEELLRKLPEEQRVLVVRHYLDGVSHADLAKSVHRTESAVRQIVSRALRHLKRSVSLR